MFQLEHSAQCSGSDQSTRPPLVYDLLASESITMKLSQIASALNARLENGSLDTEIIDTEITGLNGIEQAGPGEITFVANPKYAAAARSPRPQP